MWPLAVGLELTKRQNKERASLNLPFSCVYNGAILTGRATEGFRWINGLEPIANGQKPKTSLHPDFPSGFGLSDKHVHAIADGGTCLLTTLEEEGFLGVIHHVIEQMV